MHGLTEALMTNDDSQRTLQARARLAGLLFLADNALYVVSVLASVAGPEEIRRPAVAFQAIAIAGSFSSRQATGCR
jgi:hypothetical protein